MSDVSASLTGDEAVPAVDTSVGEVVGSYRLEKLLGEGAMGKVFLGRHVRLNRAVALKVLHDRHIRDQSLVQRFLQEARTVNEINHHHIVEVHDFIEELIPERVYCVMELLEGETLAGRLARGGLTLATTKRICRQMASALGAAHQVGVVHRDVKPDNVFLAKRGEETEYVKVLDFGVAKLLAAQDASTWDSEHGFIIGTPRYMAPEQAAGLEVDHRADIYALGTILYEMLAGRTPFEATTFERLSADIVSRPPPPLPEKTPAGEPIPEALRELTLACLAKNPDERPASMGEVLSRLGISSDSLAQELNPPKAGRGLLLAALAVLVLGLGLGLFALTRPEPASVAPVVVQVPGPAVAVPAQLPEHVSIALTTSPAGATVRRDDTGEVLGKTPVTLKLNRAAEPLLLRFELPDFEALKKSVPLDGNGAFEVTLKRRTKAKVVRDGVLDPFAD
ncbi:MAG: serine/threonine-protein kinase [Myxococcota bacterium]